MTAAKSLTPAELERVLRYTATQSNAQRNRAMLMMTVAAGLRVGEVAGLKLGDVLDEDGAVRGEIYLRAAHLPLFPTHRGPRCCFSPNTLAQHFHYVYKRAGVSGASSHSGRKTFLTSLASQGVSVFVLASLAGHKSIATTQRYITVNDDVKRRAVELAA
jgi:integrase/recombinase XerD